MSLTRITVDGDRIQLRHGQLRAQRFADRSGWVRLGLLATTALLLGGDEIEIEVVVGPDSRLELRDIAGTVAYAGRGRRTAWQVRVSVAEGASLIWAAEPLVIADGADVDRTCDLDLAPGASALLRETLVLGRSGERGGILRNRTRVRRDGEDVLLEDQRLDPTDRVQPGMLGSTRVIDSISALGSNVESGPAAGSDFSRFQLIEGGSSVSRFLGQDLASSPLHVVWRELADPASPVVDPGPTRG